MSRDQGRARAVARLVTRWQGVVLSLIGLAATLWLTATGRLGLYIHPRYFVFTTVVAIVATVLVMLSAAVVRHGADAHGHEDEKDEGDHDSEHDHAHGSASGATGAHRPALIAAASSAIVVAAVVGLLVLPPATLTSATADARRMNTGAIEEAQPTGEFADYSVKDWAALLAQGESE